jgi:hypothetical protein
LAHDAVECGRTIRVLSVVDAYTRVRLSRTILLMREMSKAKTITKSTIVIAIIERLPE